jgi:CRISPR/Cas system CSM-associated protein Csm4 (group 5 of RAMP superfamily)
MVVYASSFFKGAAQTWWRSLEMNRRAPDNWEEFERQLKAQFAPIDELEELRDQLANLKQFRSVVDYNTEFTNLILQITDLSEAEKINKYKRGLKDHV